MGKKVAAFRIIYESASNVYAPNQTVHGTVHIDLKESIEAINVTLHVLGKAHTRWSCHKHGSASIRGHETYMDYKIVLWDGGNEKILPAGIHNFNFDFPLPSTCPPNYEGLRGYIRYYCKAKIERLWKFDKTVMSGFTVLPHFDLNTVPNAASPVVKDLSKNLGFIFKHGELNVKTILPKSGYVPGENIDIYLEFVNESSRPIDCIDAKLVEFASYEGTCTCYSHHLEWKQKDRTVARMSKEFYFQEPKILAKTSRSEVLSFQVPPIVPSFNNCSIIQVNYILKVKVYAQGFVNNSVTFGFSILIGTYPINNQTINPLACPAAPPDCIESPHPTIPSAEIFGPPPSYAECMFGQGSMALDDEDTKHAENIGFAPRYLFYNFPTSSGLSTPLAPPES